MILGDPGSGKSFFSKYIINQIIKLKKGEKILPIYIPLGDRKFAGEGINNCINLYFSTHLGFKKEEISLLRSDKNLKWLFILDGYDEKNSPNYNNIYDSNNLSLWNANVIITCRNHYLPSKLSFKEVFFPNIESIKYSIIYILPFSKEQIEVYLQKLPESTKDYCHEIIHKFLNIKELLSNPIILKFFSANITEVRDIFVEHKLRKIRRSDIYRLITNKWLELTIQKSKNNWLDKEPQKKKYEIKKQIYKIAVNMLENRLIEIQYDPESDIDWIIPHTILQNGKDLGTLMSPLKLLKDNTYGFLHKSFRDFLSALFILEQTQNSENDIIRFLNKRSYTDEHDFISFFSGIVNSELISEEKLKRPNIELLFNILSKYKHNKEYEKAVSNILFLLNSANYNFSGKDLSAITISNIDLSGGWFENCNFANTYISNVKFYNAWLSRSNFENACLINVEFEKDKIFINPNEIACAAFNQNEDKLVILDIYNRLIIVNNQTNKIINVLSDDFLYGRKKDICFINNLWHISIINKNEFDLDISFLTFDGLSIDLNKHYSFSSSKLYSDEKLDEIKNISTFSPDGNYFTLISVFRKYTEVYLFKFNNLYFQVCNFKVKNDAHSLNALIQNKYFGDTKIIKIKFYGNKIFYIATPRKEGFWDNVSALVDNELNRILIYMVDLEPNNFTFNLTEYKKEDYIKCKIKNNIFKIRLLEDFIEVNKNENFILLNYEQIKPYDIFDFELTINGNYLIQNTYKSNYIYVWSIANQKIDRTISAKIDIETNMLNSPQEKLLINVERNINCELKIFKLEPEQFIRESNEYRFCTSGYKNKFLMFFLRKYSSENEYIYNIKIFRTDTWEIIYQNYNLIYAELSLNEPILLEVTKRNSLSYNIGIRSLDNGNELYRYTTSQKFISDYQPLACFSKDGPFLIFFNGGYRDITPTFKSLKKILVYSNNSKKNITFSIDSSSLPEDFDLINIYHEQELIIYRTRGLCDSIIFKLFDFNNTILSSYMVNHEFHGSLINTNKNIIICKISDYKRVNNFYGYHSNINILIMGVDLNRKSITELYKIRLEEDKLKKVENYLVISDSGSFLLFFDKNIVKLFNIDMQEEIYSICRFNSKDIKQMQFSKNDDFFFLLSHENTIYIYNLYNNELLQSIMLPPNIDYTIYFTDINNIVVINNMGDILCWKLNINSNNWILSYTSTKSEKLNFCSINLDNISTNNIVKYNNIYISETISQHGIFSNKINNLSLQDKSLPNNDHYIINNNTEDQHCNFLNKFYLSDQSTDDDFPNDEKTHPIIADRRF